MVTREGLPIGYEVFPGAAFVLFYKVARFFPVSFTYCPFGVVRKTCDDLNSVIFFKPKARCSAIWVLYRPEELSSG